VVSTYDEAYPSREHELSETEQPDDLRGLRILLHDAMLVFAIARRWPGVFSNSLEPGWVPTKMGGSRRPFAFRSRRLSNSGIGFRTYSFFKHAQADAITRPQARPGVLYVKRWLASFHWQLKQAS
jgi:hypothetical protein